MITLLNSVRASLKYRILVLLLLSLLSLMTITAYATYKSSLHEMDEILNGQMVTNGRALFSLIALELREDAYSELPMLLNRYVRLRRGQGDWQDNSAEYDIYDSDFYFQLTDDKGVTVFSSRDQVLIEPEQIRTGLFSVSESKMPWHVFGLRDTMSGYYFFTAQSQKVRKEYSREAIEYMLTPFIAGTVLILIAAWFATLYGLKPLNKLSADIDRRDGAALSAIENTNVVTELEPLVTALNRLFQRVKAMLVNEQRFSADASHELRTPLAGILANLDALKMMISDDTERQLLDNIETSVTNAKEVTEGLLLLSKLGHDDVKQTFSHERFNAEDVIRTEINRLEASGSKKRFNFTSAGNSSQELLGSSSLFSIVIKNLLDNALRHGGGNSLIDVTLLYDDKLTVTVRDYGRGVPSDQLNNLFERFFQVDNTRPEGVGLGLAIVGSIANYFSATIDATNSTPSGLSISLIVPRCPEAD